ncbi:MAG: hypothetical protein ABJD11_08630 [Gemmatimonadota bacterium]
MIRRLLLAGAALAAFAVIACSDIVAPSRFGRYEWRLFVAFDSLGPREDSLTFHWPASSLPVKIWVENQYGMPGFVQHSIGLWKNAFLYGEYDAVIVTDSSTADVIVRTIIAPLKPSPSAGRLASALFPGCSGETDIDTVATRNQLRLPVHAYVYPKFDPTTNDLTQCFRITATHELGHTLGLFQHSGDTLDVMFSDPVAEQPSPRDIRTVETVYHFPVSLVPVRP